MFRDGLVAIIVHVKQLVEGFDHPPLSVCALFTPFRSIGPYMQVRGDQWRRGAQGVSGWEGSDEGGLRVGEGLRLTGPGTVVPLYRIARAGNETKHGDGTRVTPCPHFGTAMFPRNHATICVGAGACLARSPSLFSSLHSLSGAQFVAS